MPAVIETMEQLEQTLATPSEALIEDMAKLEGILGQSVRVVNQPGASGSIGTKSALDASEVRGIAEEIKTAGDLGTYVVLGMLDTQLADWNLYLTVANASVVEINADSFDQLLEAMQANPDEVSVATVGLSSAGHNAMELISQATL